MWVSSRLERSDAWPCGITSVRYGSECMCGSDASTASGGVGSLQHLVDGVTEGGADAVLAASIFHFGEHTVAEAKSVMADAGIRVRPS